MKVSYNITQNKFNASLNQETTEIKVSFKTGYYPLPVGLENYYTKSETFSQSQINTYLGLKLDKGGYTGTAQSLKNEIDSKQKLLSSFDESIFIENNGNIEGNVSLFEEYFEQQECELNFTPIQIIGVYVNGIKQRPSSYTITLPKKITVTNFTSGDYIEIQYTKLKI